MRGVKGAKQADGEMEREGAKGDKNKEEEVLQHEGLGLQGYGVGEAIVWWDEWSDRSYVLAAR